MKSFFFYICDIAYLKQANKNAGVCAAKVIPDRGYLQHAQTWKHSFFRFSTHFLCPSVSNLTTWIFYTYHSFSHPQGNHHKMLFIIDLRAHSSNSEPSHQACCLRRDCCRCWWSVWQERHQFDLSGNNERGLVTESRALLFLSSLLLHSNSISYHTHSYLHQWSIRLWKKNELLRTWSKSESTFKLVCFAAKLPSPLSWNILCKT